MKEIPNFPSYFADEQGVIWTTKLKGGNDRVSGKTGQPRPLAVSKNRKGYCLVSLDVNGKTIPRTVHSLVLETFVGPKPEGMEACHYPDRNKENNRLENLRWDTHGENARDNYRDRGPVTEKRCKRCLSVKPVADFYRDKRASDGLKTECKKCHIATSVSTRDPDRKRKANREHMRRARSR